jgi:hypothetical protein
LSSNPSTVNQKKKKRNKNHMKKGEGTRMEGPWFIAAGGKLVGLLGKRS